MTQGLDRSGDLSPTKRQQILEGARRAFAELGYERASVDRIAADAGVSKATVYNHFQDKRTLFVACFSGQADDMREGLLALIREPPHADLAESLQRIGEQAMALRLQRATDCLYRYTIAETRRFPEIGQNLFERGPKLLHDTLAEFLGRHRDLGALEIDDLGAAAVQFSMLCQGDLVVRAQLGVPFSPQEVQETVRRAVSTFLRAYRPVTRGVPPRPAG